MARPIQSFFPAWLVAIVRLLVYSNIYVALPVTALALQTFWMWETPIDWPVLGFIYFATLFLYSFHRLAGLSRISAENWSERHRWAANNRGIVTGTCVAAGLAAFGCFGYIWFTYNAATFAYLLLPAAFIALGYALPVVPSMQGWKRLRDLPLLKIVLIAAVVTVVTLWLPLSTQPWFGIDAYVGAPYWAAYTLQRMLFLLAITIPFDVRDAAADARVGLATVPTVFGVPRALKLAAVLALLAGGMAWVPYWLVPMSDTLVPAVALSAAAVVALVAIGATRAGRGELFFALAVEGTMLWQCALYALAMSWI